MTKADKATRGHLQTMPLWSEKIAEVLKTHARGTVSASGTNSKRLFPRTDFCSRSCSHRPLKLHLQHTAADLTYSQIA